MSDDTYRTSLSDLNLFLQEPALWFFKNYLHHRHPGSPKFSLGRAVETGVNYHLLMDWSIEQCIAYAMQEFHVLTDGVADEEHMNTVALVPGMVTHACAAMDTYGKPDEVQKRIERIHGPTGIKIVGYIDYLYPRAVVDLKTKSKMATTLPARDLRQITWYADVTERPPEVVAVTKSASKVFQITEAELVRARKEIDWACNAMVRIKRNEDRWQDVARLYPPREYDNYMWTDKARQAAKDIYG